jgi:phage tail tape-measure protein
VAQIVLYKTSERNKISKQQLGEMKMVQSLINKSPMVLLAATLMVAGCAGGPLTTREKGAGIGTLGGAAAGGLIGAAVGHPAAGALIGGGLGLGAGALIGDQMQGQQNQNARQDEQIRQNQNETIRQQNEIDRLRRQQGSEY